MQRHIEPNLYTNVTEHFLCSVLKHHLQQSTEELRLSQDSAILLVIHIFAIRIHNNNNSNKHIQYSDVPSHNVYSC
jgi:hypothetical protein